MAYLRGAAGIVDVIGAVAGLLGLCLTSRHAVGRVGLHVEYPGKLHATAGNTETTSQHLVSSK